MTDLRYRIADAILGAGLVGVGAAGDLADAVIAELGLRVEHTTIDPDCDECQPLKLTRYLTDWTVT